MDRSAFAHNGPVTDATIGFVTGVGGVLRGMPNDRAGVDLTVVANLGPTGKISVRVDARVRAYAHGAFDDGIWSYVRRMVNFSPSIDNGSRMNGHRHAPTTGFPYRSVPSP